MKIISLWLDYTIQFKLITVNSLSENEIMELANGINKNKITVSDNVDEIYEFSNVDMSQI